jgi:tetratricopeptide (TPR) repeat protein
VNRGDYIQTAKLIDWVARYDHLQGAYRSAEILLHRQLEIGHNVLGEEHPYTLTTMNNLALTLGAQGDLPDARKIHEQVLEITRRTLGEEHPNTSLSACNLVLTLLEMGENAGAIDILKKDLLWLLKRDPVSLEANQQKIREMIIQMIGQKDQTG